MDLAPDDAHLALTYIAAVTNAGATLSVQDFESYMRAPGRRPAEWGPSKMDRIIGQSLESSFALFGRKELLQDAEAWHHYLTRVGWIDAPLGGVKLTTLGKAMLRHLNSPVELSEDAPLQVVIDPSDALAYARIFAVFSNAGDGMLVDPYLGFEQLRDLTLLENVKRVLTGDKDWMKRAAQFSIALKGSKSEIEVRYLPQKRLHDRFFIADVGSVLFIGSSLNSITSRPGVIAPISDAEAADAMRGEYDKLWESAKSLRGDETVSRLSE